MLDRHRPAFEIMQPEAAAYVWAKAHARWPHRLPPLNGHGPSGAELFEAAQKARLFTAELAITLAADPTPLAAQALEAIVGHPLTRAPSAAPPPETDEALRARILSVDRSATRAVMGARGAALDSVAAGFGLSRLNAEGQLGAPRPKKVRERRVSDPRIVELVAPNPRRPGTAAHQHYACWRVGDTVDQCIARGLPPRYVTKSVRKGWVRLGRMKKK